MNPIEQQIEDVLRGAPRPTPPSGLKAQLIGQAKLPIHAARAQARPAPGGWLRRWWLALTTGALSVAGAAVLTVQHTEILQLTQSIQALAAGSAGARSAAPTPALKEGQNSEATTETADQEIARLKGVVSQLEAEVGRLDQTRAANERMRSQLARSAAPTLTAEEKESRAKARAENIQCVNNLKQLGLAAKIWALDNTNLYSPDLRSMSNEISSLKILVCPGDRSRQPPAAWSSVSAADSSYEYLTPSAADGAEPFRVMFLCPIHGTVCLCDGSVQSGVAKEHPERLVQRDGKMYYQQDAPAPTNPAPQPANGGAPNP